MDPQRISQFLSHICTFYFERFGMVTTQPTRFFESARREISIKSSMKFLLTSLILYLASCIVVVAWNGRLSFDGKGYIPLLIEGVSTAAFYLAWTVALAVVFSVTSRIFQMKISFNDTIKVLSYSSHMFVFLGLLSTLFILRVSAGITAAVPQILIILLIVYSLAIQVHGFSVLSKQTHLRIFSTFIPVNVILGVVFAFIIVPGTP